MAPSTIVLFEGVSKTYQDVRALNKVSFQLAPGEVFGYIGPNGAGKTTTLKILAGLLTRFEGDVRVDGRRMPQSHREVHHLIGFLPQSAGFQNWRTTESALRSLGQLSGLSAADTESRITPWLERFDLARWRRKKIKKLSGGMIQKLGLIQAVLHRPKLVVLDEPLAGLDPVSRNEVKDVVRECRAEGSAVLFSSHILSDVQDVADRVGILHQGRLLADGTIDDLKSEMPVDVEVRYSTPPTDMTFLTGHNGLEWTREAGPGHWKLRMKEGVDTDEFLHGIVEASLRNGGRLRRIGTLEPNLDDLYARKIEEAEAAE